MGPGAFIETNVNGTFTLLEAALKRHWRGLEGVEKSEFRFLHVSTDEVYGSLTPDEAAFCEETPYRPNSPYSASKASVSTTWCALCTSTPTGLPVLTTNCSNNYGPYQFPEKLIPLMIHNALSGKPLPVYGDGQNVRDWLYVTDHCDAILTVLEKGRTGRDLQHVGVIERAEANIDVVKTLCATLDELHQRKSAPHAQLIAYVDR